MAMTLLEFIGAALLWYNLAGDLIDEVCGGTPKPTSDRLSMQAP